MKKLLSILLLIVTAVSFGQTPVYTKHVVTANGDYSVGNGIKIAFGQFLATQGVGEEKPALCIFLHGQGERGTPGDTTTANGVDRIRFFRPISLLPMPAYTQPGTTRKRKYSFLFPQCSSQYGIWPEVYVAEMIKWAKKNLYNLVDTNMIMVTGLSQGGGGSLTIYKYKYIMDQVSCIVSICPGYFAFNNYDSAARWIAPTIVYMAANDPTADPINPDNMIFNLNGRGHPLIPLQYRRFTGTTPGSSGHNIWDIIYVTTAPGTAYAMTNGDNWVHNQTLWEWGLQFSTHTRGPNGPRRPAGY